MVKSFYDSENLTVNKVELSTYIKNITDALDEINKVGVAVDFVCPSGKSVSDELEDLKAKIPSIKTSLSSFEEHLVNTNKTYSNLSDEVSTALDTFSSK